MSKLRQELRELGNSELRQLGNLLLRNRAEVEQLLDKQFQRKLFYLSKDDEKRLLTFRHWSEKYKVSVGYILSVLIPYYAEKIKRRTNQKGLPVRIATLVGKSSEFILKQQIEREFPDGENRELWRQAKQKEILLQRDVRENGVDEFEPKRKTLLDYEWPSGWMKNYKNRLRRERRENLRAIQNSENRRRPYRGNPFP